MFGVKKVPETTLTDLLTDRRKGLAEAIERAAATYMEGRCDVCLRMEATEADMRYYDSIDPTSQLPLEATEHLCWEFNGCLVDPEPGVTESRLLTQAVLEVLDTFKTANN